MVLVFPRCASKSGVCLDGASSSHAHGCHDYQMWGQRVFLHVRIPTMWGLQLVKCIAVAKAAGNTFVPFISFP